MFFFVLRTKKKKSILKMHKYKIFLMELEYSSEGGRQSEISEPREKNRRDAQKRVRRVSFMDGNLTRCMMREEEMQNIIRIQSLTAV